MSAGKFVESLENLGYFKYVDAAAAPDLKSRVESAGWDGIFLDANRMFRADGEDLAEGGVERLLRELEPFLERQGVTLSTIVSSFGDEEYTIEVNDRVYSIWQAADLERSESEPGWLWGVASCRTMDLLDSLLSKAGSPERAYGVNGGNDLFVFFLTEPLHGLITSHPDASRSDRPYAMVEEYPWFGQPH